MKRILTAVVVIPLFIIVTTTPAHAVFGSILAGIQRAMMISNQVTQIYKDTMAKITFDGQLTEMIGQAAHLKEQALGTVGALTDPFTELASLPTQFIGLGLSWKNDFTGIPRGIASSVENMGETGKSFRESWANGSPPPIRYRSRTFLVCSRAVARKSRRGLRVVISRRVRPATSAWSSITPRAR